MIWLEDNFYGEKYLYMDRNVLFRSTDGHTYKTNRLELFQDNGKYSVLAQLWDLTYSEEDGEPYLEREELCMCEIEDYIFDDISAIEKLITPLDCQLSPKDISVIGGWG